MDYYDGNEYGEDYFCLCADGCYAISVGGGAWDAEISWELLDEQGTLLSSGGAPDTLQFSIGLAQNCIGCTAPDACNYDIVASEDDASCTFPGCTASTALNYDPEAGCDDGLCSFLGDFDLDQDVDMDDLLTFLANFGCTGPDCVADLDNDWIVGLVDLLLFLGLIDL